MKKRFLLAGIFAISALMTACSDDDKSDVQAVPDTLPSVEQSVADGKVQITFHGTADGDNSTSKTVIAEGTGSSKKVNFVNGDQISVFDGISWSTFSTTGEGESADFTGEALSVDTYYMVYPATDGYSIADGKISATIPAIQQAVKGTFDPKANVSVAKCANGEDFQLKNVCSLLRLVIPAGAEYDKIIVKSNSGDNKIAGSVSVDPETGVATITDGVSEIQLTPGSGKIAEGEYYVALIPQSITDGITVELYNGNDVYAKLYKKELSFVRSKGLNATMKDFDYEALCFDLNGVKFKMMRVSGYSEGDFYLGETEVTQALWKSVMGSGNNPSNFKGDLLPVETISWGNIMNGVDGFIMKLNDITGKKFRLPNYAEWLFAARGGSKTHNYMYSGSDVIGDVAWYSVNSNLTTHEVGTKNANELGLYDMTGNVWEWCEDAIDNDRVDCGGSWREFSNICKDPALSHTSSDTKADFIGFRLAL